MRITLETAFVLHTTKGLRKGRDGCHNSVSYFRLMGDRQKITNDKVTAIFELCT